MPVLDTIQQGNRKQKWRGKNSGQMAKEYFMNWKENYLQLF
jgi:hypothetical protein